MKRLSIFALIICVITSLVYAGINPPKRGYFLTSDGGKAWYTTKHNEDGKYFSKLAGEDLYIHTFEEKDAMPNNDTAKMMIANLLCRWYVNGCFQKDAKFKTDPTEWKKASGIIQKKGFKIECENYSLISVWIDLKLSPDKKHILQIYHIPGVPESF